MRKRRFIAVVVVAVCGLAGLTVAIRRSRPGTLYRGQPLETWTVRAYQTNSNAVATLKELGTNVIPELIKLLKTQDSFLRRQTWIHLPRLPAQLRRNIARKYPPPQSETTREAAARALGRLGEDARFAIPALSRALRDTHGRVRWESAAALGSIGQDAVPALIEALDEPDAKARHAAAYGLGEIGPRAATAVPALVRMLSDPDQAVRNSAAYSLTTVGTPGFLALVDCVEQGQQPAQRIAASMLTNSYLPHLRVTSELFEMTRDESPAIRKRALAALRAIRMARGLAIHASISALEDPSLEVRLAAVETLAAQDGTETNVLHALTGCLQDESPQIREAAERALGQLGDRAREQAPPPVR